MAANGNGIGATSEDDAKVRGAEKGLSAKAAAHADLVKRKADILAKAAELQASDAAGIASAGERAAVNDGPLDRLLAVVLTKTDPAKDADRLTRIAAVLTPKIAELAKAEDEAREVLRAALRDRDVNELHRIHGHLSRVLESLAEPIRRSRFLDDSLKADPLAQRTTVVLSPEVGALLTELAQAAQWARAQGHVAQYTDLFLKAGAPLEESTHA